MRGVALLMLLVLAGCPGGSATAPSQGTAPPPPAPTPRTPQRLRWSRVAPGSLEPHSAATRAGDGGLALAASFSVHAGGQAPAVFGVGEPGETALPFLGQSEADRPHGATVLARWKRDGALAWAQIVGSDVHVGLGAGLVPSGEDGALLLLARLEHDLRPRAPGKHGLASLGQADAALFSFLPDGALRWARRFGGPGHDEPLALAPRPGGGCVVALGAGEELTLELADGTSWKPPAGQGHGCLVLVDLDADGRTRWARAVQGVATHGWATLHVTPAGDAVVQATFRGEALLAAGEVDELDVVSLDPHGGTDGLAFALDPAGRLRWALKLGGTGTVMPAASLSVGETVLLAGDLQGELSLGTDALLVTSDRRAGSYLIRIGADGVPVRAEVLPLQSPRLAPTAAGFVLGGVVTRGAKLAASPPLEVELDGGLALLVHDAEGRCLSAEVVAGGREMTLHAVAEEDDGDLVVLGRLAGAATLLPATDAVELKSDGVGQRWFATFLARFAPP